MAEDEIADGTAQGPFEKAAEIEPSGMEPEALEALRMLDEIAVSMELDMALSPETGEPEVLPSPSKEDQQDRIEYRGKKALEGIVEIADYLNPVHAMDGAAKPQPLLALSKVVGLIYRELWSQRTRFARIERTLEQQTEELVRLSIDVGALVNLFHSNEAET